MDISSMYKHIYAEVPTWSIFILVKRDMTEETNVDRILNHQNMKLFKEQ